MSFWKILGGAVIGVGAVAAAPFTGGGSVLGAATLLGSLAGAGTIATAVGVGIAGAAVGGMMDDDDDIREKGKTEGYNKAKAEFESKLKQHVDDATQKFTEGEQFFKLIVAMHAVGIACANCDGEIHPLERADIEAFAAGVCSSKLPERYKEAILKNNANIPNINTAFALAKAAAPDNMNLFDDLIQVVIRSDKTIHPKEKIFVSAWTQLKNNAA